MFGSQALRMLREKWHDATQLAEELYAMFQDDIPLEHTGPITLYQSTGQPGGPALDLRGFSNGDTVFNFTGPAGEPQGGIQIQGGQPTVVDKNGQPTAAPSQQGGGGSGNAFPGVVLSGGGSTYQVQITTEQGTKTVSVTQLQISSGDIPAGSACIVVKIGNHYSMQCPVWM